MVQADAIDRASDAQLRDQPGADEPDLEKRQAEVEEDRVAHEGQHQRGDEGREDAGHSYDSAERREAMAAGLDHIENKAAVDARVLSDVAQGRPATETVAAQTGNSPKARKSKGGPAVLADHPADRAQSVGARRRKPNSNRRSPINSSESVMF